MKSQGYKKRDKVIQTEALTLSLISLKPLSLCFIDVPGGIRPPTDGLECCGYIIPYFYTLL